MRRTKIVATLGPACDPPQVLAALIDAGVDVVRLGLAHGTPQQHVDRIERVRALARGRDREVAVLCDLPGPKLRAGAFPEGGAFLAEGDAVVLVAGRGPSDDGRITVDEPDLAAVAAPGDTVVLGDGTVTLTVGAVDGSAVRAVVRSGGRLQGRPGVHLPAGRWSPEVPTAADLSLVTSVGRLADWVAVSFVRRPGELARVREALGDGGPRVMAKIETRAAVEHLDELLEASDGVMVARGDLGIECAIEEVPLLQKDIIRAAVRRGIPVVTATQMLESMITAPTPTRAEASDVANAVADGTDALMLSAETAIGAHPLEAVRTMDRIASRAEQAGARRPDDAGARLDLGSRPGDRDGTGRPGARSDHAGGRPEVAGAAGTGPSAAGSGAGRPDAAAITVAMAHAAHRAASELDLAAIVCCTRSGLTARSMAALRPRCRLVGASPSPATARQLALSWGVEPLVVGEYGTIDEMVGSVMDAAVQQALVHTGDTVAVLAGAPDSPTPVSDVLRVVAVR